MDEFLSKHKETARENARKEDEAAVAVKEVIFRLDHHYKIAINTDSMFRNNFHVQNHQALQRLYNVLETLKDSDRELIKALEGTKFGLDSASADYAVDYENGSVFIDREGSPMEYIKHIKKLDTQKLRDGIANRGKSESESQEQFKRVQRVLDKFAGQLGIKSIEMAEETSFYTEDYQMNERGTEKLPYNYERELLLYRRFAANIKDHHKLVSRPWPKGKMKNVPVVVRTLNDGLWLLYPVMVL